MATCRPLRAFKYGILKASERARLRLSRRSSSVCSKSSSAFAAALVFFLDHAEDDFCFIGRFAQAGIVFRQGDVGFRHHLFHVGEHGLEERIALGMFSQRGSVSGLPSHKVSTALPKPYQAGSMRRFCIHENTHGIARKS